MRSYPIDKKPVICITTGDPRGIGAEVTAKALKSRALKGKAGFIVLGAEYMPGVLPNKACNEIAAAAKSIEFINTAARLILSGKADALVTGPVNKESINKAGIEFSGHTEYLAQICGVKRLAMMFISDRLKVSLVTRHCPLASVSRLISVNKIYETTALTHNALKSWFGIKNPKIGISGLNPHCGEGGIFGSEEKSIICPAVKKLNKRFGGIFGPVPADSLLYDVYHGTYDAGVCMYHDQGLTAFKMVSRSTGVNITLGLPFIRTSVDHGTGFDIAGKGQADPGSMIEAIRLAIYIVASKKRLNL